ncbi:MAG: hypothetical protein IT551_09030 [Novosphingobium sp.]|jgi:hypothetical protein|nr:hypothetical protein [Novosphingobium sp.]
MLLEPRSFETTSEAATTPPPRRLSAGERLLREIRELAGPLADVISHDEAPWASITFTGARHSVVLRFAGSDAVSDGERFIAALPDHEFQLRSRLVADASVTRVDHEVLPAPLMEVECELLLLDQN